MAQLIGLMRVTRDAEVRSLPSGEPVATLSLVYNYGTKKDERGYLPSQFIEVGLWGKRAIGLAPHLLKGTRILAYVSDVHIQTYQKQDGSPGHKLAGRLDNLEFAGSREDASGPADAPASATHAAAAAPARQARPTAAPRAPAGQGSGFEDMDDDTPF